METEFKIPFYAKTALLFITIFGLVYTMAVGGGIILPILYAIIIGILLNPVVNYLTRHKVNRVFAIMLAVLLAFIFFFGGDVYYFIANSDDDRHVSQI